MNSRVKVVLKDTKEICDRLPQQLKKAKSGDEKAVHKFRVSIKKLRAICKIISALREQEFETPSTLKKIFKAAGGVREIQLRQHMLSRHRKRFGQAIASIVADDEREMIKSVERLKAAVGKFKISEHKKFSAKILSHIKESFEREAVLKYLLLEIGYMDSWLSQQLDNSRDVHKLRIEMKSWYYGLQYSGVIALTPHQIKLYLSYWDPVQELIGQWHDQQVFLDQVREELRKKKKPHDKDIQHSLAGIEKQAQKKTSDLLARIQHARKVWKSVLAEIRETIWKMNVDIYVPVARDKSRMQLRNTKRRAPLKASGK